MSNEMVSLRESVEQEVREQGITLKDLTKMDRDNQVAILDESFDDLFTERMVIKAQIKEMEERINEIDTVILKAMDTHKEGVGSYYRMTCGVETRASFDKNILKKDYPEAYNAALKETVCHPIRVYEVKKDEDSVA